MMNIKYVIRILSKLPNILLKRLLMLKRWVVAFREFLDRNMPFFDVFEKVLVGAAAILFGYTQLKTSTQEFALLRKEFEPVIILSSSVNENNILKLEVTNEGGKISDFHSSIKFIYTVSTRSNFPASEQVIREGLFNRIDFTKQPKGILISAYSSYFVSERINANVICEELDFDKKKELKITINTLTLVSYKNNFDENVSECYFDGDKIPYDAFTKMSFNSKLKYGDIDQKSITKDFIYKKFMN